MTANSTNDRIGKHGDDREAGRVQNSSTLPSSSSATSPPSRHRGRQDLAGTHYRLATETGILRWAQEHLADAYPDLGIPRQPQRPPRRGRRRARGEGGQQPRRRVSNSSDASSRSDSGGDTDTEGQ